MDLLAPVRAFDRFQRRHAPLAIAVAVVRNFSDQEAGNSAALIAYWGFFSLFPLLLVFTTILGFVLQSDPSVERSVVHSAIGQFPIIGVHTATLSGSGVALAIGLVAALVSGLGVTLAAQKAFNRVYAVPHSEQPNFLVSRWRGLKLLLVVGVMQVLSTIASGLVTGGLGGPLLSFAGIVVSLLLNLALFYLAFRFLTDDAVPTHDLLPGVALATVGWEVLQAVGGLYVKHVVKGADEAYGTFATVIGLLAWLYLGARIVVYAAEINVVLRRRLWPRSLMDPPEPADRRARAALAKMEERDDKQTVDVEFHPPVRRVRAAPGDPTYAVAPAARSSEAVRTAAAATTTRELHDLTVGDLLDAIHGRLDEIDLAPGAREQATRWLDRARAGAQSADAGDGQPQNEAARALALATTRALGLAPSEPAGGSPGRPGTARPPRSL